MILIQEKILPNDPLQLTALGRMHLSLAISGVLWQRLKKQNIREDLKKLNKYWEFLIGNDTNGLK